jgi:hypothetical protein
MSDGKGGKHIDLSDDSFPNRQPAVLQPVVSSIGVLEAAAAHQRERAVAYDQPTGERSAGAIAAAFNAITRREGERAISESEAWLFLQVLKQVRLFSAPGYHADSAEDNVSYGALLAESLARANK